MSYEIDYEWVQVPADSLSAEVRAELAALFDRNLCHVAECWTSQYGRVAQFRGREGYFRAQQVLGECDDET